MQPDITDDILKWIRSQFNPRIWAFAGALAGFSLGDPMVAMAQYDFRDLEGYGLPRYDPYGGGGPYERDYGGPGPGYRGRPQGEGFVPVEIIQRRIRSAGYRTIAPPRHKGNIYLAEVEDRNEIRHRLVYDAFSGQLLENTPLGPVKKLPSSDVPNNAAKDKDKDKAPQEHEAPPTRSSKAVEPKKIVEPKPAAPVTEPAKAPPAVPAEASKMPPEQMPAPATKPMDEPAPATAPSVPPASPSSIVDDALKPASAPPTAR